MKYLSLTGFMSMYGDKLKEIGHLSKISYQNMRNTLGECVPFRVAPADEPGLNDIYMANENMSNYGHGMLKHFKQPLILEMEWLKAKEMFEDEVIDVLTQMGYFFIAQVMSQEMQTIYYGGNEPTSWMDFLERHEVVIEVESLEDVPKIVANKYELHYLTLPKLQSWNVYLMYADNFSSLFWACTNHSNSFVMFYYHLPFLLSIFIRDYFGRDLDNWKKSECITTEQEAGNMSNFFMIRSVMDSEEYSYGMSPAITSKDVELFDVVFTLIYNKLHEKNNDIGLISLYEYRKIQGPDVKRASVHLSRMGMIDWDEKIQMAEYLKTEQAEGGV